MSLATPDELADYLGIELDTADTARAQLILDGATGTIQAHTRQTLTAVAGDTVILAGTTDRVLALPQRPVTSVTTVVLDGVTITDHTVYQSALIRDGGWGDTDEYVTVTYDHGYTVIPDVLREVCLSLAARRYVNPELVAMRQHVGTVMTQFQVGDGLTRSEKDILRPWRMRLGSIRLW